MLYDTCNYHILYHSKLINVHPITTVLTVNLTSKRMNNSCALLRQNSTTYDQCTLTLVVRLPVVPRSARRTRRRHPGIPGSKKKKFFFKMFHGRDSDMFVVIVGQYCSA